MPPNIYMVDAALSGPGNVSNPARKLIPALAEGSSIALVFKLTACQVALFSVALEALIVHNPVPSAPLPQSPETT